MGGAREHNGALQQHHGGRRRSERSVVVVRNCGLGDGEGEKNMYRLWSAHFVMRL
jgi:hypothetical protein